MAAGGGGIAPLFLKERTRRSSLTFLLPGLFKMRRGLSSPASAIGTAVPQTRASHQKLVRGTRRMLVPPRTNKYRADCQLTHEATSLFRLVPCAPVFRLAA